VKYKSCTEYWLDTETCSFRGQFEEMYRDIDDPWGCQAGCLSLNNRLFAEILFEGRQHYKRILDVGCGLGGLTSYLARRNGGGEVLGCDISETAVNKACSLFPEVSFRCLDVLRDHPEQLGTFDLVTISEVLWYILDDLQGVFGRLHEVLSPGGVLGIHQFFPAQQRFGKDIIDGLEGFERMMHEHTAFSLATKVTSHVADGLVLLATFNRGE